MENEKLQWCFSCVAAITLVGLSLFADDEDQARLAEIAKNDKSWAARREAMEKLTDQAILVDIAKNDTFSVARMRAVERITDQVLLGEVAKEGDDVWLAANKIFGRLGNLKNQAVIADVAKNAKSNEVRCIAIDDLCIHAALTDIAMYDKDETVQKAATERLKMWHGIPNAQWVAHWFEEIDALKAGWEPLREMSVPAGDLEVRVWIWGDYNISGTRSRTEGFRFCRTEGEWTGFYARDDKKSSRRKYENNQMNEVEKASYEASREDLQPVYELTPETMTWTEFWDKVEALGILSLPDDSVLNKQHFLNGEVNYVVEVNNGGHYRTYHYSYADVHYDAETQNMIRILKTLEAEFRHTMPPRESHSSWGYQRY